MNSNHLIREHHHRKTIHSQGMLSTISHSHAREPRERHVAPIEIIFYQVPTILINAIIENQPKKSAKIDNFRF